MPETFTASDDRRSPAIPAPDRPPITFRGKKVSPSMILDLWKQAMADKRRSRQRILACRAMRRKDPASAVKLSPMWKRKFPEAAAVANLMIEERITLERNLIAAVGAVEPEFEREAQGFRDTDRDAARECKSFLEEWRLRCVPTPSFAGKSVEDGEFALIQVPCDLDMDGAPDYFEYILESAYEDLDDDDKKAYDKDEDDRRKRYVKRDEDGNRVPRAPYLTLLQESDDDTHTPDDEREQDRDRRHKAAQAAHDEDVAQYILRKQLDASAIRIIPALDCAPVLRRGRRRDRWELSALVTRELYEPWDLIDAKEQYRWKGMGDRKLIPQAYREDGGVYSVPAADVGLGSQVYVYTAYLPVRNPETGCTHILICTTIGGASTWDAVSGDETDPESVSVIDLYHEYEIEGEAGGLWPFVSYHWGLRLEDDSADHYGQPYLWAIVDRIKAIENALGSIRSTVNLVSFTGHYHQPDPRWASSEDGIEAILDGQGNLRRPKIPRPGEVAEATGPVVPALQAQIGQDAWKLLEIDIMALKEATAIDQIPASGSSGHQLLVQQTLGQVAKRHNRECVQGAVVACGEAFLRICDGIYRKYKIRWPLRTVQERPVRGEDRAGRAPTMYDPEWVQDSQFNLSANYPDEENLARIDMERALCDSGYGNTDRLYKAMGEKDPEQARMKADRDRLNKLPAADALRLREVARKIGNRELLQIAELQAQQLLAPGETPGLPGGVPMETLRLPGEPQSGGGSAASSVRGGIEGAQQSGDAMAMQAQAAVSGTGEVAA